MGVTSITYGGANATATASPIDSDHQSFQAPSPAMLTFYVALGLVGYVSLCSALRFRRINRLQAKYKYTSRDSLASMTVEDAQVITNYMIKYEHTLFYDLALRLALLRTYTVKNVAKLLLSVSDLSKRTTSSKRYADTALLYTCWAQFKPQDPLFLKSIERTNFLHAPYRKAGRMLNEDLLYVLWASMAEPVRFIAAYDWRALTPMEHAALGTLWKHIGDLMDIDYVAEMGRDDWVDGIEFMDELTVWAAEYEEKYMHPYPEVRELGAVLMDLFCESYPKIVRPLVESVSLVMMGERMRHAFAYPEPGLGITSLTFSLVYVRQLVVRYFALPPLFEAQMLTRPDPKTGRMHGATYMKDPWYIRPTFLARWGPEAWIQRLWGGSVPGDADKFKPEGFLFEDIGPERRMGKGVDNQVELKRLEAMRGPSESPFRPKAKA